MGGTGGSVGYMRGLTHTFGVHRSDKAHQRVGLSQSIRLPSLIGAEEHAIVRAVGTHVRSCACLPSPRRRGNQDQEPGNQHTLLVVSGTTPGKRRRSLRGVGRSLDGVKRPPTTMFEVSVQDTHPISPCRSSLFRPTGGRGTAPASLLEACAEDPAPAGTSLWLART